MTMHATHHLPLFATSSHYINGPSSTTQDVGRKRPVSRRTSAHFAIAGRSASNRLSLSDQTDRRERISFHRPPRIFPHEASRPAVAAIVAVPATKFSDDVTSSSDGASSTTHRSAAMHALRYGTASTTGRRHPRFRSQSAQASYLMSPEGRRFLGSPAVFDSSPDALRSTLNCATRNRV